MYQPGNAGELRQLAVLPEEAGRVDGITPAAEGIYVKVRTEGEMKMVLYRIPEEGGEPVRLAVDGM